MTDLNRPARLNRGLLITTGVLLLAAGGFAVATHFGRLTPIAPGSPLVPGVGAPPTWALYATAAVAAVLGLLALRWLLAQLARAPKTHTWRLESDRGGGRTDLAAKTAIEPLAVEVGTYSGVHSAHATLAGTRDRPTAALVITVEQDGDPTRIRRRLDTEGLPRLRQALDLTTLPTTVEFRFSGKAGARVV